MSEFKWWEHGTCLTHPDPDLWFPRVAKSSRSKEAKRLCRECLVRHSCGDDAVTGGKRHGIAAGFNTAVTEEWRELHLWLRRPAPDGQKTMKCSCGTVFIADAAQTTSGRCPVCQVGPVLEHMEKLARTMAYQEIGRRAGLAKSTIYTIRRQRFVTPDIAAAVLAVTADAKGAA